MPDTLVVYSMEDRIQEFFGTTTVTRAECHAKAASLVGEPVRPVPIQGMCSSGPSTISPGGRFFAGAWRHPQPVAPAVADALHRDLDADLGRLRRHLPGRFRAALGRARGRLPRVLGLPFVVTHGDPNETNLLVDGAGRVTGVVDWAGAGVLPFGMALGALEGVLGYMDGAGWHYHDDAEALRAEFWRVLEAGTGPLREDTREDIRVSRMVGLFLRYGFEYEDGSARGKVRDTEFALRYADAFCTGGI